MNCGSAEPCLVPSQQIKNRFTPQFHLCVCCERVRCWYCRSSLENYIISFIVTSFRFVVLFVLSMDSLLQHSGPLHAPCNFISSNSNPSQWNLSIEYTWKSASQMMKWNSLSSPFFFLFSCLAIYVNKHIFISYVLCSVERPIFVVTGINSSSLLAMTIFPFSSRCFLKAAMCLFCVDERGCGILHSNPLYTS